MRLAIMQPYFFPYIGYFSLIKNTDYFIFFDTPQYIRKGWINRNRILGMDGKDVYFTVPVEKAHRETAIKDIKISQSDWKQKFTGQLSIYKKRAPYYAAVMGLIEDVISCDTMYIAELAIESIKKTCMYLDIVLEYEIFSEMHMSCPEVKEADEWALYITKKLGYQTYVNPPGGETFFNADKYKQHNIELQYLIQELKPYNQRNRSFIPKLSMIDVMMFCSPEEIKKMMNDYTLKTAG